MKRFLAAGLLLIGLAGAGRAQAPVRLEASPLTAARPVLALGPPARPRPSAAASAPALPKPPSGTSAAAPVLSTAEVIALTRTRDPSQFLVKAPADYPTTGAFVGRPDVPLGVGPTSLALGDVDGDGDLDFVASTSYASRTCCGIVKCLRNDGHGNFSQEQVVPVPQLCREVALADLDGDGDLDLVSLNPSALSISVRPNDGHGTFGPGPDVAMSATPDPTYSGYLFGLCVSDLDGNGRPDLATANLRDNTLALALNDGQNTFRVVEVPLTTGPNNLAVGDLDGDGHPDLAACVGPGGAQAVHLYLNQGLAAFSAGQQLPISRQMNGKARVVDFDDDGDLDLIAFNQRELRLCRNDGHGRFLPDDQVITPRLPPYNVAAPDVNGDGYPDLLVSCPTTLLVYLNDGQGQFGPVLDVPLGPQNSGPFGLAVGDLDGDGLPDALTASSVPTGTGGIVQVRLNRLPQVPRHSRPAVTYPSGGGVVPPVASSAAGSLPVTYSVAGPPLPAAPELALYPNPTRSEATLTGALPGATIHVLDMLGRLVLVVQADAGGVALLRLPDGLATGVYLVRTGGQSRRLTVE